MTTPKKTAPGVLDRRGADSPEPLQNGWLEAAVAWEVCGSLHTGFAKGKDPFFKTRQADFVKHADAAREAGAAMLNPIVTHLRKVAADYRQMADQVVIPGVTSFGHRTTALNEKQALLSKADLLEGQALAIERGDLML